MLTALDYGLLAVLALSALRGFWRGLVSEILGLLGWVAAFAVATRYWSVLAVYVPPTWPGGALTRMGVSFAAVVIAVMVLVAVLNAVLTRLTDASGLRAVDRSLGLLFGLVRGVLIILLLVALADFTLLPEQEMWRQSLLRPYAEQGIRQLKPLLPAAFADHVGD